MKRRLVPLLVLMIIAGLVVGANAFPFGFLGPYYGVAGTGPIYFSHPFDASGGGWTLGCIYFDSFNLNGAGSFGTVGFYADTGVTITVQEVVPNDHINIMTTNTGAPANFSVYIPGLAPTNVTGASSWSFSGFNMIHVTIPNGAANVVVVFATYTPSSLIDQAFAYYGIVTANILAVLSAFVVYFASSATAMISLIGSIMTLILFCAGSLIYWLVLFVNFFVGLFTAIGNILNGTSTIVTGLGDMWAYFGFAAWASAVPVFAFIFWVSSVSSRTAKSGRSNVEIIVGDLQIVTYLVGTIWEWTYTVFNFVVNVIMQFLSVIVP